MRGLSYRMSGYWRTSDIQRCVHHVRLVPATDIHRRSTEKAVAARAPAD